MALKAFRCEHRVSYAECTLGNHVYYSRFLDILEKVRGEFFRQLGKTFLQWQAEDTLFPVMECQLKYFAPARYDDVLMIETRVVLAKGVRLHLAHRIFGPGSRLLVEAETIHVCTSVSEKPKRLPKDLVQLLEPYRPENLPSTPLA